MKKILLSIFCIMGIVSVAQTNTLALSIKNTEDPSAVSLSLSMDNETAISGIETHLVFPEGVKAVADFDDTYTQINTDRASNSHKVTDGYKGIKNDTLFVSIVSTSSDNFIGNTGNIASWIFDASQLSDGEYTLSMVNNLLVWTDKIKTKGYVIDNGELKFKIEQGKVTSAKTCKIKIPSQKVFNTHGFELPAFGKDVNIIGGKKIAN